MSDGVNAPVVIVDLDGTLYNTNTFHQWLVFSLKKTFFKFPIKSFLIVWYCIQRLLIRIPHSSFKYKILKVTEDFDTFVIVEFIEVLAQYANQEVINYLSETENIYILSTAAPALYSELISKKYNFDYCVSTPLTTDTSQTWCENIREQKLDNTQALLQKKKLSATPKLMITDHYDDLPLMKLSEKVILVNASKKTKEIVNNNRVNYTEI